VLLESRKKRNTIRGRAMSYNHSIRFALIAAISLVGITSDMFAREMRVNSSAPICVRELDADEERGELILVDEYCESCGSEYCGNERGSDCGDQDEWEIVDEEGDSYYDEDDFDDVDTDYLESWLERDLSSFEVDGVSMGDNGEIIMSLRGMEGEVVYLIRWADGTIIYGLPSESGGYIFCVYYESEDGGYLIPVAVTGEDAMDPDDEYGLYGSELAVR
jgi:hypothetical protein